MDGYLATVAKREVRDYAKRAVPDDLLTRILEAGRATGSSRNRQPWRFVLVTERRRLDDLAHVVARPSNLRGCAAAIVVAIVDRGATFDAGRVAQNMMVAAWSLGLGSCPNSVFPDQQGAARDMLALPEELHVATILSLGYAARGAPRPRAKAAPRKVLARIARLPLDELVHRETYRG